jgi:hypothetical protein
MGKNIYLLLLPLLLINVNNCYAESNNQAVMRSAADYYVQKNDNRFGPKHEFYTGASVNIGSAVVNTTTGAIGGGFTINPPMIGLQLRLGYQMKYRGIFAAAELLGGLSFGLSSGGFTASNGSTSFSLLNGGIPGMQHIGINMKLGASINNDKTAPYVILGAIYQFATGTYTSSNITQSLSASGFGLNYGIGIKHKVVKNIDVFLEFTSVAPIPSIDSIGRAIFIGGMQKSSWAFETYALNIGVDFKI